MIQGKIYHFSDCNDELPTITNCQKDLVLDDGYSINFTK